MSKRERQAYNRRYKRQHRAKILATQRRYKRRNKAKILAQQRRYYRQHRAKISAQRRRNRRRPRGKVIANMKAGFHNHKVRPLARWPQLVGCSLEKLVARIASQFRGGMSWSNHGRVWQFDHKRPLACFDLTTVAGQKAAHHFSNWQPLFVAEHWKKTARERKAELLAA